MLSKLVGKIMRKQKEGNIINISSAGGVSPAEGLGPYCMSKAGINMLTKQMAMEFIMIAMVIAFKPLLMNQMKIKNPVLSGMAKCSALEKLSIRTMINTRVILRMEGRVDMEK